METLTHGLLGWAVSQAGPSQRYGRAATAALVGSSVFPDADFVLGFLGTATYLEHHRGFTHCLLGWVPTALAVAAPVWWLAGRKNFRALLLFSFAGVGLHILCDAINAFGVMPFYPFSFRRYQLDWVFVIDLFFAGLCLFGAVLSWRLRSARPARWALAGLTAYVALCAALHSVALARVRRSVPRAAEVAAIPGPGLPTRWSGLVREGDRTTQTWFDVFGSETERCAYDEPLGARDRELLRRTEDGRVFLWFARFPVKEEAGGVTRVFDARFRLPPGWRQRRPFAVELDEAGARFEK